MEKILSISLKLNFTPNTLGCYGFSLTALLTHDDKSHEEQLDARADDRHKQAWVFRGSENIAVNQFPSRFLNGLLDGCVVSSDVPP